MVYPLSRGLFSGYVFFRLSLSKVTRTPPDLGRHGLRGGYDTSMYTVIQKKRKFRHVTQRRGTLDPSGLIKDPRPHEGLGQVNDDWCRPSHFTVGSLDT